MSADRVAQLKASTQQQQLGVEEQLSLVKFLRHAVQYKDEQIAVLQAELEQSTNGIERRDIRARFEQWCQDLLTQLDQAARG